MWIINRTELCECSLTAGAYYIMQRVVSIMSYLMALSQPIMHSTLVEKYNIYPAENIQI